MHHDIVYGNATNSCSGFPKLNARPRRSANWRGAIGIGKPHSSFSKFSYVGRLVKFMSKFFPTFDHWDAGLTVAQIVGIDEYKIGGRFTP